MWRKNKPLPSAQDKITGEGQHLSSTVITETKGTKSTDSIAL